MQVPPVSYYIYVYSGKSMTEETVSLTILLNPVLLYLFPIILHNLSLHNCRIFYFLTFSGIIKMSKIYNIYLKIVYVCTRKL